MAKTAVLRDGRPIALCETENDAFAWLLKHQGQSVDWATTHEGYAFETIEPWPTEEADGERRIALQLMRGDESHRRGDCKRYGQTARMSCGTCALHGYEPRGGWEPGYRVKDGGPNYAGWARVYVQAGYTIPADWADAFARERASDNLQYAWALERDILTFGMTIEEVE